MKEIKIAVRLFKLSGEAISLVKSLKSLVKT